MTELKKELNLAATLDNLPQVLAFLEENLEAVDCSPKAQMQISVAAEEVFVNIAHYAYAPGTGEATVKLEIGGDPLTATIAFLDCGAPFDPLAREDPDVTLSAEKRQIGGLGIYMTKKIMDGVTYEYLDGHNVLTMKKHL